MRALDGKLVEMLKSALLPAVGDLSLEIPVELSVRERLRLELVLDVSLGHFDKSPVAHSGPSSAPIGNTGGARGKAPAPSVYSS